MGLMMLSTDQAYYRYDINPQSFRGLCLFQAHTKCLLEEEQHDNDCSFLAILLDLEILQCYMMVAFRQYGK